MSVSVSLSPSPSLSLSLSSLSLHLSLPHSLSVFLSPAKTDEVLKAKVAKREEEARKKKEDGECLRVHLCLRARVCVCARVCVACLHSHQTFCASYQLKTSHCTEKDK